MDHARKRDKGCRFPLCSCKKKGYRVEVAHLIHRGMGGDKSGERTEPDILVTVCYPRHQGVVSLHSGAIRPRALTKKGMDGPIAWEIEGPWFLTYSGNLERRDEYRGLWVEIARESAVGVWEPFTEAQRFVLKALAKEL